MNPSLDRLLYDLDGIINRASRLEHATPYAEHLLELPRYAGPAGPELLARDIEEIVGEISDTESVVKSFQKAARLLFSLDMPGTKITDRRAQMHRAHGAADRWMDAAIVARVLAALVERSCISPIPAAADSVVSRREGAGIASVEVRGGHLEIFRIAAAGRLEHRWFPEEHGGNEWSGWYDHDFESPAEHVAAVSAGPDHAEVFVVDDSGTVWHRWWSPDDGWVPAESYERFGRPFDGPVRGIAAASGGEGHIDVQVEAGDGAVAHVWYDDEWVWCPDNSAGGDHWWPLSRAGEGSARSHESPA